MRATSTRPVMTQNTPILTMMVGINGALFLTNIVVES